MKHEKLVETLGEIKINDSMQQRLIKACTLKKAAKVPYRVKPIFATCFSVVIVIGCLFGATIYAEAKEYKQAVSFFSEYNLPAEGLSRDDIKRVYKDITTSSFVYGKTAEVITKSVGGYNLFQQSPTPQDIENLWNYRNSHGYNIVQNSVQDKNGITYKFDSEYKFDRSLGFDVHDKSVFSKYLQGEMVWQAEFDDFWVEDYAVYKDTVVVYGQTPTWSSSQKSHAFIAMIDADGTIVWEKMLENGFHNEYIGAVVLGDDRITVFSRGDLSYLCVNQYDIHGNAQGFKKTEIGNYGIWNAAKLGDGYIVQLWSYIANEHTKIVKIDAEGVLTDTFSYEANDCHYFITDMIEYNGNVYLSAYTVPVLEDEDKNTGGQYEVASILNYIFDNQLFDISNEQLTKLVRDTYSAVLLVCDRDFGTPLEFYSAKGSLGGALTISDDGKLLWNVESITDTYFSPMTSSFSIGGASSVYRYTFAENGTMISQEKTGEFVDFRR